MKNSLIIIVLMLLIFSCRKDKFIEDSSLKLSYTTDTLLFDTVFTTIGSTTLSFKVVNPYKNPMKIEQIFLGGGTNSHYRLNINGTQSTSVNDVEIAANDSLYIFVEVTVDPQNSNSPMSILDSVMFNYNGNFEKVMLQSWGQDVHLINGEIIGANQTWANDKPYLIYNSMLVDTNVTLTITSGTRLHFHKNSRLYVAGTLKAFGSLEEPIVFQGDRLEYWYKDIPGQWDGIYLLGSSEQNTLNYCDIKNAIIGVQADTLANTQYPTATITNCKIINMNSVGIYGRGSSIVAANTIVANCAQYAIALVYGGTYEFTHCTIYNNWGFSNRTTPSIVLNNYYKDVNGVYQVRPLYKANFGNCIITGNKEDELLVDAFPSSPIFEYKFDHCILKVGTSINTNDAAHYNQIYKNLSPGLKNPELNNFELDTLSNSRDKGNFSLVGDYYLDYNQNSRLNPPAPDLGAFERIE